MKYHKKGSQTILKHSFSSLGEDQARSKGPSSCTTKREEAIERELGVALRPSIEVAIKESLRKNPEVLSEILYPVMVPAIRKAIVWALQSMIQSLNQVLESSTSPRGISWRFEAWWTGKRFAEVALLHSLVYRVEQVFLIHYPTGLFLRHCVAEQVDSVDPEVVSGMLLAIQDFVKDSFESSGSSGSLETFTVGELTVWVERSTHLIIAAVIRGNPPLELKSQLKDVLFSIQREYEEELMDWKGDSQPFGAVEEKLIPLLMEHREEGASSNGNLAILFLGGIGLCFLFFLGGMLYQTYAWSELVEKLNREPGVIVVEEQRNFWKKHQIQGIRDPLSVDPDKVIQEAGYDPNHFENTWQASHVLEPAFILKRAVQALQPPEGVRLKLEGERLKASGKASFSWMLKARLLSQALSEISRYEDNEVVIKEWAPTKEGIETFEIYFGPRRTQWGGDQELLLQEMEPQWLLLDQMAGFLGKKVEVIVMGYADQRGNEQVNEVLSLARAQSVVNALKGLPLTHVEWKVVGCGEGKANEKESLKDSLARDRKVTFQVQWKND